jgi:hypothetical protein
MSSLTAAPKQWAPTAPKHCHRGRHPVQRNVATAPQRRPRSREQPRSFGADDVSIQPRLDCEISLEGYLDPRHGTFTLRRSPYAFVSPIPVQATPDLLARPDRLGDIEG